MVHRISMLVMIVVSTITTFSQTNTAIGENIIVNGGFEDGDTSFDVPNHFSWNNAGYRPNSSTPGQYYVGGNAKKFNSAFNGLPHSGNKHLMIDGICTEGNVVWEQKVLVRKNTQYSFEAFVSSIHPISITNLSFEINGEILPEKLIIHAASGSWIPFVDSSWSSNEVQGEIILRIRDDQTVNCTNGNDFAIDDISFTAIKEVIPEYIVFGSIYDDSTKKKLSGEVMFTMIPVDSIVGLVSADITKQYSQRLKGDKKYKYSVEKEGYIGFEGVLDLTNSDFEGRKRLDIFLAPKLEEELLILKEIEFETSKWDILPEFVPELEKALVFLTKYQNYNYEVAGHTDSRGSDKENQALSLNRANAVRNYLIAKGIKAERLTAIGYGESSTIETNKTTEGRQRNRRVELIKNKVESN